MAAMMVLLWGGVVALIASEARAMIGPRGSDEAMDTLRRRLASGEITREDFETTRRAAAGVATCASAADSGPGHADAALVSRASAGRRRPPGTSAEPASSRTRSAPPPRSRPRTG